MSERPRARRSLGQNFLIDPNIQRKIVEALDPQPHDTIVEIGPGLGALTEHMVGRVAHLIAIELDDRLAARLREAYADRADVTVIHQDVMRIDLQALQLPAGYKVIGNIPYNITTPLLFKLLEPGSRPARSILMVQKEVAQRITAAPGGKEYGALTVGVQSVARAERLFNVARGAFRPVPNVDSTVLEITPIRPAPLSIEEEADLRSLTRTLFGHRRKQLQGILRRAPGYQLTEPEVQGLAQSTGIELRNRPEQLSPAQFIMLAHALRTSGWPMKKAA